MPRLSGSKSGKRNGRARLRPSRCSCPNPRLGRSLALPWLPLFVLAAIFCASPSYSEPGELSVITYNVQFLPGPVRFANKRKNPEYRAKKIGQKMSRFDIVGLNEVFDDVYREVIIEELRKAWRDDLNIIVSPKPEDRFNGGCLIASHLPFIETHSVIYENFSKPEDYGIRADGFAAKGAIHARIARNEDAPNDYIDVFATHLEARAPEIRELQYPELAAFIRKYSDPKSPTLLLGDLNTKGNPENRKDSNSQYVKLMKELNTARPMAPWVDVWLALEPDALGGTSEQDSTETGKRIDYILMSVPRGVIEATSIEVNMYQDRKVVALSDHNAVEATFSWSE